MTNKMNAIFGWSVAAVIIAAIIGGLLMVGGPIKARDHKIDAKRLSNMHKTARVISCYADDNDDLPLTSTPARKALATSSISSGKKQRCRNLSWEVDPVTKTEFEYNRLGPQSFELCGVFTRKGDSHSGQKRPVYNANNRNVLDTNPSRESSGRFCYSAKNWDKK